MITKLLVPIIALVVIHKIDSFTATVLSQRYATKKVAFTEDASNISLKKNHLHHKKIDESNVHFVGDERQGSAKNKVELDSSVSRLEVYALFNNDDIFFNFQSVNFDGCNINTPCTFKVAIDKKVVVFQAQKEKESIRLVMNIENNPNSEIVYISPNETLTAKINKNGVMSVIFENRKSYIPTELSIGKLDIISFDDDRKAVKMIFEGLALGKGSLVIRFPPPIICKLDYKTVEGIINTGSTSITKEITTTTGLTTKTSDKTNDQTNVKDFKEKYSKKLTSVEAKAGISLKGIANFGISGSYSSESTEKQGGETSHIHDVTKFVEDSLHQTKEVKVTYVFPYKTSTIIRQLFVTCDKYAVDTKVLFIDQVDLRNATALKSTVKVIENGANVADILVLLFLIYLI